MEELREKLIIMVDEKGLLHEEIIQVSQELDKFIVAYYKSDSKQYKN